MIIEFDKIKKKLLKAAGSEDVYTGSKIKAISSKEELIIALLSVIPSDITNDDVVFVCIGTDRSTGDSLAPLVGMYLKGLGYENVYGTIDDPVHAMNLEEVISILPKDKKVIAIDACLGRLKNIGTFGVINGSLRPGSGVGKDLPPVGDYSIDGVVNVGGHMEHMVLQSTRLATVMRMAKDITSAIVEVFPLENELNKVKTRDYVKSVVKNYRKQLTKI